MGGSGICVSQEWVVTVGWLNQDEPVANMKGRWPGLIPPSTGPDSS
jgi:hypothetical protein